MAGKPDVHAFRGFPWLDLDVAGWDCLDRAEGIAKTMDGIERNRMKNRSPDNLGALPIDSLDTPAFLKKLASMIPASKANDGRR